MYVRLDRLLVDQGLVASRTQAKTFIENGLVFVRAESDWELCEKASAKYLASSEFKVNESPLSRYVSRAGLKLEHALHRCLNECVLEIKHESLLEGVRALDIGQSTGGFTDCLLKFGAREVIGVDVGQQQLHETIRENERVIFYEGINAKFSIAEQLPSLELSFDLIVMDVSFISQTLIHKNLIELIKPGGLLISLVKPQFEVGSKGVNKKGLVTNPELYTKVESKIRNSLSENNWQTLYYFESGLKGGDGNLEYFAVARPIN